jgi:alpha-D-glucose phosphate-specific phosphoglucomutase
LDNPIKFGTDGWRAIIAQDFTFDNVRICAQAVADYLKQTGLGTKGLIIGYDTRFASKEFAVASAEVVSANGIKVYLAPKAVPTQVVSYGVINKKAAVGIIITASHNPGRYNGFKVKSSDGTSAPIEIIAEIEKNIARIFQNGPINKIEIKEAIDQGLVEYFDIARQYYEKIRSLINIDDIRSSSLQVIVDSMYGAGGGYFKYLLNGNNINISEINAKPNPNFPGIQPEPIASNLKKLTSAVKRQKASIGIATDGDADRIGIVDENGIFLTQLQVFALLALYFLEVRKEKGAIVKTITTTSMLDRLGEIYKVPVYETKVGFKYVAPIMIRENALIGGEESGGYGFRGHVPERDGILAGLYFLDFINKTGKTPSQLLAYLYNLVGPHYYRRIDIEFDEKERQVIVERFKKYKPTEIDGIKLKQIDTQDGFRFTLLDNSWLLIRFSGTEPLLRIYAESDKISRVERFLFLGREIAGV